MDEARAVVADFCEKNPYLLGALPMTWFGCGPFARMVVAGVIYELRLVITRALAIADREDNKKYVELVCDTYRHWPVRVILWALVMVTFLLRAALVLNGTFRSALVQDLGARGAKEAMASTARMEMGL